MEVGGSELESGPNRILEDGWYLKIVDVGVDLEGELDVRVVELMESGCNRKIDMAGWH